MAVTLTNMALRAWNLPTDKFSYDELADNWTVVANHDHSSGKGVQIPTEGIEDGAITQAKLASGVVATPADIAALDAEKIGTTELEEAVDPLIPKDYFDVNIREFAPAVFTEEDPTTVLNAASDAISAAAVAAGQVARIWGFKSTDEFLIDGLRARSNCEWHFEQSRWFKRNVPEAASGVDNAARTAARDRADNPLIYPYIIPQQRVFTNTHLIGRPTAGSNAITRVDIPRPRGINADRPGPVTIGGTIAGPGIPAGATITGYDRGARVITISANATAGDGTTDVALTHNPSFGTTSSGSKYVSGITLPHAWMPDRGTLTRVVTGPGIPNGTTVTSIDWTDPFSPVIELSQAATASGVANLAVTGWTYFGNGRNMKWFGGRWNPNQANQYYPMVAGIYAKFVEDFEAAHMIFEHDWFPGTPAARDSQMPTFAMEHTGYNVNIHNIDVLGGTEIFMDGIHCGGGDNTRVTNCYVEAGDDCFALVNTPGTLFGTVDPRPITNYVGRGNVGHSARGHIFRPAVEPNGSITKPGCNFLVENVDMDCNGSGGRLRNSAIGIFDHATPRADRRLLRNITYRGSITAGSTAHEGGGSGILVIGANDVTVDVDMNIEDSVVAMKKWTVNDTDRVTIRRRGSGGGAPTEYHNRRFDPVEPDKGEQGRRSIVLDDFPVGTDPNTVTLTTATTSSATTSLAVSALPSALAGGDRVHVMSGASHQVFTVDAAGAALGATTIPIVSDTPHIAFPIGSFVVPGQTTTQLRHPFVGKRGSGPEAAVLALPERRDGAIRLVPAQTAGAATGSVHNAQLVSRAKAFRAGDGMAFETRVRVGHLTGGAVFVGFTDDPDTLELPFNLTGTTVTKVADNAVGFLYDVNSTSDRWWTVAGRKTPSPAANTTQGEDLLVAPTGGVNAAWFTLRVEVDFAGDASFELNNKPIGSVIAAAVDVNTLLAPVAIVQGRSTGLAQKLTLDVDYIEASHVRN